MIEVLLDRLRAGLTDSRWAGVEYAQDLDTLADLAGQVESGTAIVMPFAERALPPLDMTGGFRQQVEEVHAVGIVLRLYDPLMGEDRARAFAAYKADVEALLAGWVPPGSPADCRLVGGETSPVTRGVSIYVQTWALTRFLTGGVP